MGNVKYKKPPKYEVYHKLMGIGYTKTLVQVPVKFLSPMIMSMPVDAMVLAHYHYELVRYYHRANDIFIYKLVKEEIL